MMEIDLGPMEVKRSQKTGHVELAGRAFEVLENGRLGRLMLVQTVKPPTARVEVFFDQQSGRYSGHHLVAIGDEIEMLPLLQSDDFATELVNKALTKITDVRRATVERITNIWPELGRL